MNLDTSAPLVFFGLFLGLCFSVFYLKGIKEYARNDNLKLLSFHSFFAVIFLALFLIACLLFSVVLNNSHFSLSKYAEEIRFEYKLMSMLALYLSSFYVAARVGLCLAKKEIGYKYIKPDSHWNKVFSKNDQDQFDFFITVIVETGGQTWLYIGAMQDYSTNNGELEYIQIRSPYRRTVDKNESPSKFKAPFEDRFYKINSDTLIIKYADIKSIGIKTMEIDEAN